MLVFIGTEPATGERQLQQSFPVAQLRLYTTQSSIVRKNANWAVLFVSFFLSLPETLE